MGCAGKLVGIIIGGIIAGALIRNSVPGMIIGGIIGHLLFDKRISADPSQAHNVWRTGAFAQTRKPNYQNQNRNRFISSWCGMIAKMAKADGIVSQIEISTIEDFFDQVLRLDSATRKLAIIEFKKAKNSHESFSHYAREFLKVSGNDRRVNRQILDILVRLASADGTIHPAEGSILREAASIFGVTDSEYSNMKTSHSSSLDRYFAILGLSETASNEDIKSKYHELALEYHPDVIAGRGMPEDFIEYATKRFQEIQEAYSAIKKDRDFR